MAMINCPECNGSISSKALFCPHCGYPIEENQNETEYELKKGTAGKSAFALFLRILAAIIIIGGIILAYTGANITKVNSYGHTSTEFSFTNFITILISYAIYGILLFGMAAIIEYITDTYYIISGLNLNKKQIQRKTANRSGDKIDKKPAQAGDKDSIHEDEYGWLINDSIFVTCPNCSTRVTAKRMMNLDACPQCHSPHVLKNH